MENHSTMHMLYRRFPLSYFFFTSSELQVTAGQQVMSSQKKALNDLTVCPLFYASNVIQTFTFFKYDWSRLDIIDIREGKKIGEREREREKSGQVKNFYYVNRP